jgi:drug/metabolite transporter (DMT)-like permease
MGLTFAFLALFFWGIGDFLIQKTARVCGDWVGLFSLSAFASVFFLPFVYKDIPYLFENTTSLLILILTTIIYFFGALIDFEALKQGKISVVEPIYAFEIPVASGLAIVFLKEHLTLIQILLILLIITGIFLVSVKSLSHLQKIRLERGVILAILATVFMGVANFLFGVSSRETNPFIINWFTGFWIMIISFTYLWIHKKIPELKKLFRADRWLILGTSFFTNMAWLMYSWSMVYIPVSIATSISESYIAFAALLGVLFNKERLKIHQIVGLLISIVGAIALGFLLE